jgi:hypothetical protein
MRIKFLVVIITLLATTSYSEDKKTPIREGAIVGKSVYVALFDGQRVPQFQVKFRFHLNSAGVEIKEVRFESRFMGKDKDLVSGYTYGLEKTWYKIDILEYKEDAFIKVVLNRNIGYGYALELKYNAETKKYELLKGLYTEDGWKSNQKLNNVPYLNLTTTVVH